ncbi:MULTISPECIES: hypothetical protein [unclassified Lentimonas]|uniref:hypothetical protein n=1 Tax=unclassified Lentimonas TaxID=2630993 RepID=UPI001326AC23|nr:MULTISPECIES: hypothetical protein [unclassified Lentimonas]CAA6677122.1 Unannotated [Lentimonas sp. CC4]CAA6686256.1 Unannotated [Lentimonas sp. CC6]CAA7074284.1 Unannotated [Lentimonas sp. CC4]CAA7171115.1 Unannotated [Lentimonas sp. CC21]CAA7180123.1 Unannotated [Lentimonas sp. CC8]
MKFLSIICALFIFGEASALPLKSLVIPGQVPTLPVSVRVDSEMMDGFMAETVVVSTRDFSLSSGINNMWYLPRVENGAVANFNLGRKRYIGGDLRVYPRGGESPGWVDALPELLVAAQSNPANEGVRFKFNEDGSIQFLLPTVNKGREILDENGKVVFSNKREVYPSIWGSHYYVVEYEMTENSGTEDEIQLTVNELFLQLDSVDLHIIFRAPTQYHASLYQSFMSYLKDFYISKED